MMYNSIFEFYQDLESIHKFERFDITAFENIPQDEERQFKSEFFALANSRYLVDQDWVQKSKTEIISHLKERLSKTSNEHLEVKYNNALYLLTKDNRYAKKTIESYISILSSLLSTSTENGYSEELEKCLDNATDLSLKVKYKEIELKDLMSKALNDESICPIWKVQIIRAIRDNGLKIADFPDVPAICCNIIDLLQDGWKETIFDMKRFFSNNKDSSYRKTLLEKEAEYELSQVIDSDKQPNNIAIPHMNMRHYEKAMECYSKSGNKQRYCEVEQQFVENNKNLRYLRIKQEIPLQQEVIDYYNTLEKTLLSSQDFTISELIYFERLSLLRYEKILNIINMNNPDDYSYKEIFIATVSDINRNSKKSTHENEEIRNVYWSNLSFVLQRTKSLLYKAVKEEILTLDKLQKYLMTYTYWGTTLAKCDNGNHFDYPAFSSIANAMKSFFREYMKIIDNKPFNLETVIDILPAKFEAALREIVHRLGGKTISIDPSGQKEVTLDGLLNENKEVLKSVFSDDDLFFFKFVFTPTGLNIRNNVAHGFLTPYDYTLESAILIFLAILRLGKCRKFDN